MSIGASQDEEQFLLIIAQTFDGALRDMNERTARAWGSVKPAVMKVGEEIAKGKVEELAEKSGSALVRKVHPVIAFFDSLMDALGADDIGLDPQEIQRLKDAEERARYQQELLQLDWHTALIVLEEDSSLTTDVLNRSVAEAPLEFQHAVAEMLISTAAIHARKRGSSSRKGEGSLGHAPGEPMILLPEEL